MFTDLMAKGRAFESFGAAYVNDHPVLSWITALDNQGKDS